MYLTKSVKMIIASLTLLISQGVHANYMVYPMSESIKAGENKTLKVFSKSPDNQFIKITVKKILNAGTEHEFEEIVKNWDPDSLIVSPSKIILSGGGSKVIRLTQVDPPSEEKLYRVYFEGVRSNNENDKLDTESKKTNATLSVNIILAALVRVLPETEKMKVTVNTKPENITIKNSGNVRVGIKSLNYCSGMKLDKNCKNQVVNRYIYPQQEFMMKNSIKGAFTSLFVTYKNTNGDDVVDRVM